MVLCVLDEVGPDGIRSIIVQDGYLMAPDIGQQDINGPVDEWYGEFEGDLSMGPPHMGDGGFLTGEGTVLDAYPVIGLDAADGRYQTEVTPVVGARTDEGLHHDIWHRGRMSFYIKVETQVDGEDIVLMVDEGTEVTVSSAQEDEVLEDTKDRLFIIVFLLTRAWRAFTQEVIGVEGCNDRQVR